MMARLHMDSRVHFTFTWHTCMSDRSNRLSHSADWLNLPFDPSVVLIRTLGSQFLALRHDYDPVIPSVRAGTRGLRYEECRTAQRLTWL